MKKILSLLILSFFLSNRSFAQNTLHPTQIVVFKNGTYFVVKEGSVSIPDAKWSMVVPTDPLLSTFWLTTGKEMKITRIDFDTDTIKSSKPAKTLQQLMEANKGKKVSITYSLSEKESKTVGGILVDYLCNSNIAKVKDAAGTTFYIDTYNLVDFSVTESPNEMIQVDSMARLAKIYFNKAAESTLLKLSYMSRGIQWLPSYNIKVIDDKTLQLEMKALIENYSEPINDAELTLTVGSPQFLYGQQVDPLALNYFTSGNLSTGIYPASATSYTLSLDNAQTYYGYEQNNKNADFSNADGINDNSKWDFGDYTSYNTEGDKSNDLYMYKVGKVSLPKDTKSSFSVFAATIPYDDIYEVNIYDVVNYVSTKNIYNDPEQKFPVYHSFKLNNTTSFPFTTAPVFVQDEKLQPLAQDKIKYTPVGANVKVQLSKAPDVSVKNIEEEKSKQDNARKFKGYSYNLVTIKGKIEIENLQDKSITLNTTKKLTGSVLNASDNAEIKKPGTYSGLNPYSSVEWNIKLASHEKKTISYEYTVYVYVN